MASLYSVAVACRDWVASRQALHKQLTANRKATRRYKTEIVAQKATIQQLTQRLGQAKLELKTAKDEIGNLEKASERNAHNMECKQIQLEGAMEAFQSMLSMFERVSAVNQAAAVVASTGKARGEYDHNDQGNT